MMTDLARLKEEIEKGPLAAELAPFWADTFEAEPEPEPAFVPDSSPPAETPEHARWSRIRHRFGALKPDAAFAIKERLAAAGLHVPYTFVADAKGA